MYVSSTVVEAVQRGVRVADCADQIVAVGDDRPQRHWRLTDGEWAQLTAVVRRVVGLLTAQVPEPTMSDGEARFCATRWYGGMGSALYALSSTGAIVDRVFAELDEAGAECTGEVVTDMYLAEEEYAGEARSRQAADLRQLDDLRRYVAFHGPRGPQVGWLDRI